jgi:hypothetical protein
VLAGYAKCPKCHTSLPYKRSGTVADSGGTVAVHKESPVIPIAVAVVVAGGIIAFFALRGHKSASDEPMPIAATAPLAQAPQPTLTTPPPATDQPFVTRESARPAQNTAVPELEKALRSQRLWSTLQVVGDRVDLRSATCAEPAMAATIDAARAALRSAGLTRLRCLEESGVVVLDRIF